MNRHFLEVISAHPTDRRNLFLTTANRLNTPLHNIEKDFWVSWMLDLLFNAREPDEPRLLFKGGTSLSKAYSLISRFSEDVDITVFREDIGQNFEVTDLEGLSGKKQRVHLEAIRTACQTYINGKLKERLNNQIKSVFREAGVSIIETPIESDPTDPDQQTLLFRYPSVNVSAYEYVRPEVKIEAGAKSALDPHRFTTIRPYIEHDLPDLNLSVENVVTIDAERTFWDKVVILHGLRRWYDNRKVIRQQGHRVSRHYYDVYKIIQSPIRDKAIHDHLLALGCAQHAQIFFNSTDLDLKNAIPGSLCLTPSIEMVETLTRDYQAMSGMIFGEIPEFSDVLQAITDLERRVNQRRK